MYRGPIQTRDCFVAVVNRWRRGARNTHALCADAVPGAIRQASAHSRRRPTNARIDDITSVAAVGGCVPRVAPRVLLRVARLRHVPVYRRLAGDMDAAHKLAEVK
jgi:hypothetical protein